MLIPPTEKKPASKPLAPGADAACAHCGQGIPAGRSDGFCCTGCLAVNRLLNESGLQRYYDLKPARTAPLLGYFDRRPALGWLEGLPGIQSGRLDLSIEGVQCGACVWVIGQVAQRRGPARAEVNSALGRLRLSFDPQLFDAKAYLESLADLGYRVRPFDPAGGDPSRGLLLRLGVCAAITMNTMSFSLPFYFGLADDGGLLSRALRGLSVALTTLSIVYGGSYFFRRAWAALRHGAVHFDITIALGLGAAYAGSLWALATGRADARYFDSVNLFLTLMLLGRFLQERSLLSQRRQLLAGDGFALASVTALEPVPHELPWAKVEAGQRLLLQPGALCPSDALLEGTQALEFDLASLNGERRPSLLAPGSAVPAGARLLSAHPALVCSTAPFRASLIAALQALPEDAEALPVLWRWAVNYSLAFVLIAATAGLLWWWPQDPAKAVSVFVAVLVVTCPCALGIAVPLARTMADRRLAARGITIRQPGLLERLQGVEQVWLDKTGTLTLADLELRDPEALGRLSEAESAALMGAAAASRHPVSRALYRELSARGVAYPLRGQAEESPGQGVHFRNAQGHWFLGRSMDQDAWAELSLNGRGVARFQFREQVLQDGPASIARLRALGLRVGLLSGDSEPRVQGMAASLGLAVDEAHPLCSPASKERFAGLRPALMVGDGLNDGLALRRARASGTPSWERSALADRSDFRFSSGSLSWLPELFDTARPLRRALWGNLAFSLVYNVSLVALALSGGFSPLLCAITMPGSSLIVVGLTARALRR